jgi:hypothetical protein
VHDWTQRVIGPCDTLARARRECKFLHLNQHTDQTGNLTFGSPTAKEWADDMYLPLNLTHKAFQDPALGPRLFPSAGSDSVGPMSSAQATFLAWCRRACRGVQAGVKRVLTGLVTAARNLPALRGPLCSILRRESS